MQAADRLHPRPVQPEDPRLGRRREAAVTDKDGFTTFCVNGFRVEWFAFAGIRESSCHRFAVGPCHCDHRTFVVPTHKQVFDLRSVEDIPDEQQIVDHRLVRCGRGDGQRVSTLEPDDVGPLPEPRDRGR